MATTYCVLFNLDVSRKPENFAEIVQHEQAFIKEWATAGFLNHFYLRETRDGAVFFFKDKALDEVKSLIEQLPLYPFTSTIEYLALEQQF